MEDAVAAVKELSRDVDLKAAVRRQGGGTISGLEHSRRVLGRRPRRNWLASDEETDWILREWAQTLRQLSNDRPQLVGRLDWVTKLWLLETFAQEERIEWDDPWLASLDLAYHNIDPDRGLFCGLENEGKVCRFTTDAEIQTRHDGGPA